jgi:hypothetical protein
MDHKIITLPSVLHILGLARNLIFVSKMDDAGVKAMFEKETCRMVRGEMMLLMGVHIGTLYKLLGSSIIDGCNISGFLEIGAKEGKTLVVSREKTILWHQILEHIGEKGLRVLPDKDMFEGVSDYSLYLHLCEHCLYGKQNPASFSFGATRARGILQFLHTDVFGLVTIPSLVKSMYYVSFIYDFSRNTWIYFLRKKSKVFDKFKEFKALVENQTKKKIKVLRMDNGGEM